MREKWQRRLERGFGFVGVNDNCVRTRLWQEEREINSDDIINVILNGEIIRQYEDDEPFPSCLILGMSVHGRYLHVVVASDNINLHIITAYYPSLEEWESDFKTRKRR